MLPLAGRQNKLRAPVSQAPPGWQHGQAGLAAGMCPQEHTGPRPLASEQERLSLPWLLVNSTQEYKRLCKQRPMLGSRFEVFCAHQCGKQKPHARSESRPVYRAARGHGGRRRATTAYISILLSVLTRMSSFDFFIHLGCYNKNVIDLGNLNNKHLFFSVLETETIKTKALADVVSGESQLPCSSTAQPAVFLLCPDMAGKRQGPLWGLFFKGTNSIHEGSAFVT